MPRPVRPVAFRPTCQRGIPDAAEPVDGVCFGRAGAPRPKSGATERRRSGMREAAGRGGAGQRPRQPRSAERRRGGQTQPCENPPDQKTAIATRSGVSLASGFSWGFCPIASPSHRQNLMIKKEFTGLNPVSPCSYY